MSNIVPESARNDLAEKLTEYLDHSREYAAALEIVRKNSRGNIWLMGGMVYRPLANFLYGTPVPPIDLDFIVDQGHDHEGEYGDIYSCNDIHLPEGWSITKSRYADARFFTNPKNSLSLKIDVVQLKNFHSIQSRNLLPTIENFLSGTPLTIQSIAYDIDKKEIMGNVGLSALLERKVGVHYLNEARYFAHKRKIDLHEMIRQKAASLGFEAIYPPPLDPPEGNLSCPPPGIGALSLTSEAGRLSHPVGENGIISFSQY